MPPLSRLGMYADIVQRSAVRRQAFWGGAVAFWESQKAAVLRPGPGEAREAVPAPMRGMLPPAFLDLDTYAVVTHHLQELAAHDPGADVLARMTYLEFKQRLPELLLMRVDKMTMSTSVEARVPFLDHHLVEFTMGLPRAVKLPGGDRKGLLKRVCRGIIPDEIIDRRKVGFGAPMSEWLRGPFGDWVETAVLSSALNRESLFDRAAIAPAVRAAPGRRRCERPALDAVQPRGVVRRMAGVTARRADAR